VKRRTVWTRFLFSVLAIVVAIAWAFPVYWMINSSFLSTAVLESFTPTFFPADGTTSNYTGALADGTFFSALGMSVGIGSVAGGTDSEEAFERVVRAADDAMYADKARQRG